MRREIRGSCPSALATETGERGKKDRNLKVKEESTSQRMTDNTRRDE